MWRAALFACLALTVSARAAEPATSTSRVGCWVGVSFEWPDAARYRRDEAFGEMRRYMDEWLRAMHPLGPSDGPLSGINLQRDYAVFAMRAPCPAATTQVRDIFAAYRETLRLRPDLLRLAPEARVSDRSLTKYEYFCGPGAEPVQCPQADRYYPDDTQGEPLANAAANAPAVGCWVGVRFDWPASPPYRRNAAFDEMRRYIQAWFVNRPDFALAHDPLRGLNLQRPYAVVAMRARCPEATAQVRDMLERYRESLRTRPDLLRQAPVAYVSERGVTKYDYFCGLGAVAARCPHADWYYPDDALNAG